MSNFFNGINEYLKCTSWYDLCDWIFADHFTQKYWKNYTGQFIKKVKEIDGLGKRAIRYDK